MKDEIYNLLQEVAENNKLEFIETTSSSNGYPSGLSHSISGFEDWEQLEKVKKELQDGLQVIISDADEEDRGDYESLKVEVVECTKRDGWQLWYCGNRRMYECYDLTDYYSKYNNIYYPDEKESHFIQKIVNEIDGLDSMEKAKSIMDYYSNLWCEIENLGDDEMIVEYNDMNYDVMPQKTMSFCEDTHHYSICLTIN